MISRSIPSKVALGAAAVVVVAAGMISSASGASAADPGAPAVVGAATPAAFNASVGTLTPSQKVVQTVVDVPSDGWYEVNYMVGYPNSEGLVKTWIGDWQLPDLVTPIAKSDLGGSSFGTNVKSQCVFLYAGQHAITSQAVRLPYTAVVTMVQAG
jgi:hypothetical protein